ncbi:hypothetical protein [Rheinheimera sp.]|jgi:hypothetical protein|uniref:hypothetical protein n=1 Tax=Rheinheimera sp. TaxID=1869214 RepID=UPI00404881A0
MEFLKKLNQIDIKELFKTTSKGSRKRDNDSASKTDSLQDNALKINLGDTPKSILAALFFGVLLVVYALFNAYRLYAAHTDISNSELNWQQSQQQYMLASQQLEEKLTTNKKHFQENDIFIKTKSEFERNIYRFHKAAGMEIVKTNEDDEGGRKYLNYVSRGNFNGIRSVLREMQTISLFSSINMVSISVLPDTTLLELQIQVDYTDISPVLPYISGKKMSYLDGGTDIKPNHYIRTVQFAPLKTPEGKITTINESVTDVRDPFFTPQERVQEFTPEKKTQEVNPIIPEIISAANSNTENEKVGITLHGCMIADTKSVCVYRLPNKSLVFKSNGDEILDGYTQLNVERNSVTVKKAKTTRNITIGEQFND